MQELVEAAARGGDADLAHEGLERLSEMTQPCGTDIPLGIEARSRALLSDGPAADELYREAIARLSRTRVHPELARAHLVYGEWLRREGRRVDARGQLRTAHEMLVAIGMEAFAERARAELQATGEKVRKRTVETRNDLTPQEWQIARLARDGLSNPEIGARLFLSPRTVEWHLRNVFTKLEIRSRRELATALASSDSQMAPALSLTSGPGRKHRDGPTSCRVGALRWWDEDRGPVDCLWPVGIRRRGDGGVRATRTAPAPTAAPTSAGSLANGRPSLSGTRPANAAITTLLTTATIPAAVSISCHALGASLFSVKRRPVVPRTTTRYGSSPARVAGRSRATSRSDARTGSPRWRTEPDAGMSRCPDECQHRQQNQRERIKRHAEPGHLPDEGQRDQVAGTRQRDKCSARPLGASETVIARAVCRLKCSVVANVAAGPVRRCTKTCHRSAARGSAESRPLAAHGRVT